MPLSLHSDSLSLLLESLPQYPFACMISACPRLTLRRKSSSVPASCALLIKESSGKAGTAGLSDGLGFCSEVRGWQVLIYLRIDTNSSRVSFAKLTSHRSCAVVWNWAGAIVTRPLRYWSGKECKSLARACSSDTEGGLFFCFSLRPDQ